MCATRKRSPKTKQAGRKGCCGPPVVPEDGICLNPDKCAEMMKVLADPNRLRIIRVLINGPHNVGEISEMTRLTAHRVSHHLARMRLAGLVESVRQGQRVIYSVREGIAAEWGLDLGCCSIQFRALS